jgi:predicted MFS family arabinose efflux permease
MILLQRYKWLLLTRIGGIILCLFVGHQLGAFFGVWLGGGVFDHTGCYDAVWILACALSVVATLLHWRIDDQRAPTVERV